MFNSIRHGRFQFQDRLCVLSKRFQLVNWRPPSSPEFLLLHPLSSLPLRYISCFKDKVGVAMAAFDISENNRPKFTNRLAKEHSPYLLQHAHNPRKLAIRILSQDCM
ncbi:hypothetical protein KP509_29G054400 [Ceratopteris richardii]|uniref:Uncharacterized protein n=1 Tax=Ceratopteris richardii TaxID=49495 RepID=A0A8T2R8U9_CERRI|nr:hypothetical protein KP509_29G054400 [Ceratopteris richardii]